MNCLWCREPLRVSDASITFCDCGVSYARELLINADSEMWQAAERRDEGWSVERNGSLLTVYRAAVTL